MERTDEQLINRDDINELVKANIQGLTLLLQILEVKFTQPQIRPGQTIEEIMFNSGSFFVLEHFRELIKQAEEELQDNVLAKSP